MPANADPAIRLKKRLARVLAQIEIGADQPLDGRHDLVIGKARARAFTDHRGFRAVAEILILSGPISCSIFNASNRVAISCATGIDRAVASAQ